MSEPKRPEKGPMHLAALTVIESVPREHVEEILDALGLREDLRRLRAPEPLPMNSLGVLAEPRAAKVKMRRGVVHATPRGTR